MRNILLLSFLLGSTILLQAGEPTLTQLREECDDNNAKSCNLVGYIYDEADGICESNDKAALYYQKSCKLGYTIACDNYKTVLLEIKEKED